MPRFPIFFNCFLLLFFGRQRKNHSAPNQIFYLSVYLYLFETTINKLYLDIWLWLIWKNCIKYKVVKFCDMSGQQVNYDKSSIFFSRNVLAAKRATLSELSGLKETQQLGKYLGVSVQGRLNVCWGLKRKFNLGH
jgi:hypothetical protein